MGATRDEGLQAAMAAAGGLGKLARALGIKRQSIAWRSVPQARLFEVAEVTGLSPAQIRPDLADWISGERIRRRMALATSRHSLVRAAVDRRAPSPRCEDEATIDVLIALAACRFVAAQRGLSAAQVMVGDDRPAAAARSLALALAHVAGRAKSSAIAGFFGVSRQNVDNASERYLRARDGDDPGDFIGEGADGAPRVIERGRVRRAKDAAADLWDLERKFLATIQGDAEPERRRA